MRKGALAFIICAALVIAFIAVLAVIFGVSGIKLIPKLIAGKGTLRVENTIASDGINEFYYTLATSSYPPQYQRYRFYRQDGKFFFYHEKREGRSWPLREEHITVSGTVELSQTEWNEFYDLIKNGKVKNRKSNTASGGSSVDLYLYWDGDCSKYQQFDFGSINERTSFEELCCRLADSIE